MHRIRTDLQYVRNPVGFDIVLSDAVPSLLLSDYYGLNSLANGHTFEEGYRIGYDGFTDYKQNPFIGFWKDLLEVVDMQFTLPIIGLSEVATQRLLANSHQLYNIAQSCVRGKGNNPCMNCYKCFRRDLLEKIMNKVPFTNQFLDKMLSIKDVNIAINHPYPHFGNVLTYITSQYKGNHTKMNHLKKKVRGDTLPTQWMENWYPNSQEVIAPHYKQYVLSNRQTY